MLVLEVLEFRTQYFRFIGKLSVTLHEVQTCFKILKVSCGNYHTLLLSNDGQVFSFGSNYHGQLGVGDTRRKVGPQVIPLPNVKIVQIAAGANHSVLRSQEGLVYTFGSNRQDQLGRNGRGKQWHASPGIQHG